MEKLQKQRDSNAQFARSQLLKHKIKHQIEFIQDCKKQGTSLISLTVPPRRSELEQAIKLTNNKNVNAENIKNRTNRQSVEMVTAKLILYLKSIKVSDFEKSNGLILYVGVFGKLEHVLVIDIPPLEIITQATYSCDTSADFEHVDKMMRSKMSILFAVVDGQGIRIWSDIHGVQTKEYEEDYLVVRFENHGGQSENRFLHTAQNNRHQQVTNSINRLLTVIRNKNKTFDSMFICGNSEFRKEVIQGFKDSDLVSRVSVIRDIPLSVDSANIDTLGKLKSSIQNITQYIAEDTIYAEKVYTDRLDAFFALEEEELLFGLDDTLNAIAANNVKFIAINDTCEHTISQQTLQNFGIPLKYTCDREDITLIEMLLEYALDQNIELAIIQSEHAKSRLRDVGEFYVVLKY